MFKKAINQINVYKQIILMLTPTILLLFVVIMSSFSWYWKYITGNDNVKATTVEASKLETTYVDGPSLNNQTIAPGWTGTKTFTVTNTGDQSATYKIAWKSLTNEFLYRQYLIYSISSTNGGATLSQTQIPNSGTHLLISDNISIPQDTTQTYTITFQYLEANADQSSEKSKKLEGTIEILNTTMSTSTPQTSTNGEPPIPGQGLGDMTYAELMLEIYPVGSVFTSLSNTNPSEMFGGTWERIAGGKTLVGVDEDDTDFESANLTGGSETHLHAVQDHTLTSDEIPAHTHTTVAQTIPSSGVHQHQMYHDLWSGGSGGSWRYKATTNRVQGAIKSTADATHSHTIPAHNTSANEGLYGAHNHGNTTTNSSMQPYVTLYIWKRTA